MALDINCVDWMKNLPTEGLKSLLMLGRQDVVGEIGFSRTEQFFESIGFSEIFALDISGPNDDWNITHDLNIPVSKDLENKFDCIIDGGTLEHVFHVGTAFESIHRMLRTGGVAIHLCVMNNTVNHGFYQLSPTALFSTYEANKYEHLSTAWFSTTKKFLPEGRKIETKKILETYDKKHIARLGMSARIEFGSDIQSANQILMGYCVRKKVGGAFKIPQQAIYSDMKDDPVLAELTSVLYL